MNRTGDPSTPSGKYRVPRSAYGRILHRSAIVTRTTIAVVLALVSLSAGLAWAANWVFPLAVLHTVGLGDLLRAAREGVSLFEDADDYVYIWVDGQSVDFTWTRLHREARGGGIRYFYEGSWPAGIRTQNLRQGYKRRLADGSSAQYRSSSTVFLELPLWGLCLISGPYPIFVLYRGPIRRRQRRRRGLCLQCGYDLRLLTEPRCPECFTQTENN